MANSPSIPSPSLGVSTKLSTIEEAEANGIKAEISPTIFQKMMAELVGTYILIFMGCGAALVNKTQPLTIVGIAMVWGLLFMALAYTVGHVSGCHLNPAVTIAFAADRKFPCTYVCVVTIDGCNTSILASLTLKLLFQDNIHVTVTQYSDSTTHLQALVWEFIVTFILMFTICGVATDHRASKNLSGVAIGVTVLLNAMVAGNYHCKKQVMFAAKSTGGGELSLLRMRGRASTTGPITGASMNPARSFGPAAVTGVYKNLWVYIVAPVLGALAATAYSEI